jgi:hypothetical protein
MMFITREHDGELCYSAHDHDGNPIPREPCDQCRKDFIMANASSDTDRQLLRELGRRDPAAIRILTTDERADGLALAGTGRYERQDGPTKPFSYRIDPDGEVVLLTPEIVAAESYAPPDGYREGLKALRAAEATAHLSPEARLKASEDEYKRQRTEEFARTRAALDAAEPEPRLTAAELSDYAPPDPYKAGLDKMRREGR